MPREKSRRAHAHKPKTLKEIVEARREADARREAELYGAAADDARFLRTRGYVVTREPGGFRVGNRLCNADTLREIAARERRLVNKPEHVAPPTRKQGRPKGYRFTEEQRRKIGERSMAAKRAKARAGE